MKPESRSHVWRDDAVFDVEFGTNSPSLAVAACERYAARERLAERGLVGLASKLQIVYQDLAYSVCVREGRIPTTKVILKGMSGIIEPARLTAVMGASGAGKTTFLNVLAGYAQGDVTVSGRIAVNGEEITPERMRRVSGFVHQEDCILSTMTVREVLYMAAQLKLPPELPKAAKLQRALDVAEELNISRVLDNFVGDSMTKAISGGEKRRLSLGTEMITNPALLYLDEPTSGLDTHTAYKVVSTLRWVASAQGRTIVATIHQPSSDIFHMFHDLVVLADGQVMYHGPAENMVAYLARHGYPCPTYTNPADYLFMDVLNRGAMLEDAEALWRADKFHHATSEHHAAASQRGAAMKGSSRKQRSLARGAAGAPLRQVETASARCHDRRSDWHDLEASVRRLVVSARGTPPADLAGIWAAKPRSPAHSDGANDTPRRVPLSSAQLRMEVAFADDDVGVAKSALAASAWPSGALKTGYHGAAAAVEVTAASATTAKTAQLHRQPDEPPPPPPLLSPLLSLPPAGSSAFLNCAAASTVPVQQHYWQKAGSRLPLERILSDDGSAMEAAPQASTTALIMRDSADGTGRTPAKQPPNGKGGCAWIPCGLFASNGVAGEALDTTTPQARQAKAVETARILGLLAAWWDSPENAELQARVRDEAGELANDGVADEANVHYANFGTQFILLSGRAARNMWRNPLNLKGKLASTLILALAVGLIFRNLNNDLKSVLNREGCLFYLIVQTVISAVIGIITVFGTERPVFRREYGSHLYGLPAYFWSRYMVELPFQLVLPFLGAVIMYWLMGLQRTVVKFMCFALLLVLLNLCGASLGIFIGCLCEDISVAMVLIPIFTMPLMLFSGFIINSQDIPVYLAWIQYMSPMRYGFFAAISNEFGGLKLKCKPDENCVADFSGEDVIAQLHIEQPVLTNMLILLAMSVGLLGFAYVALWNTVRRITT